MFSHMKNPFNLCKPYFRFSNLNYSCKGRLVRWVFSL